MAIPFILLVIVVFGGSQSHAFAAEPELGELAASSLEARRKADAFSFDTGGVGIVMSYGTKNGVSAEEVGSKFVNELFRRGVESRYFYFNTERDGMAMEFYIRHSAMGPWDVDEAAANISNVVRRAEAAKKILGN